MSLGFKGEQNRSAVLSSSVNLPKTIFVLQKEEEEKVVDKTNTNETTIIRLPGIGNCLYYTSYSLLVISGVSALWVSAIGMWWIKYYIECNQGVIDCPGRS
tara:strand:+ start:122 stop:424 length:303 start_codon:yes stop_codon:yes gene_type:complete